jgi:hypothetical protein
MVNLHNPVVTPQVGCAWGFIAVFRIMERPTTGFLHSDFYKALARRGWCFHVSLHLFFSRITQSKLFLSRWEFTTTLDYEWRVFRGRLPYRWTIWVRIDRRLTLVFLATMEHGADLLL